MAMQKLLPQKAEGEYYVNYNGLDKEIKAMTYKHQNWYAKKVKMIQVSGSCGKMTQTRACVCFWRENWLRCVCTMHEDEGRKM
jgi:hypothetical protein